MFLCFFIFYFLFFQCHSIVCDNESDGNELDSTMEIISFNLFFNNIFILKYVKRDTKSQKI